MDINKIKRIWDDGGYIYPEDEPDYYWEVKFSHCFHECSYLRGTFNLLEDPTNTTFSELEKEIKEKLIQSLKE